MAENDDILEEAQETLQIAQEDESNNRDAAAADLRFARLGEQWPEQIVTQRKLDKRPCHTINLMPSFLRQVTNDARLNKPSIKVRPVDSGADPETAKIMSGLVRNIEQVSNADIAYDTALDFAASGGFGFIRVDIDFAHDDSFDKDIRIEAVANPFAVYGDPWSIAADSSDWNHGFVLETLKEDEFKRRYPDAEPVNVDHLPADRKDTWRDGKDVTIAEYWRRDEVIRPIVLVSNGRERITLDKDRLEQSAAMLQTLGYQVIDERDSISHEVRHFIMSGVEILEADDWPGRFIPIVPVYGDMINIEGTRYVRSMIRDAKDSQRSFNYWRTAATELVALAPKAPFVGPKGAFKSDRDKWGAANSENFPYLEYDGPVQPRREAFAGLPAGAVNESAAAHDDMKSVLGLFDPALGNLSNEISGVAINSRQRQSDVSTFHFVDNLARAIRHTGQIIVDLIPAVYNGRRVVRVLGEDGSEDEAQLCEMEGGEFAQGRCGHRTEEQPDGSKLDMYDLSVGKYDLVVSTGPAFTTRREEAAAQMMDLIKVMPQAAPIIGDLLAGNLDWPGAEEIAERLRTLLPPQLKGDDPQMAQMAQLIQQLQAELANALDEQNIEQAKLAIDTFEAETKRLSALADARNKAGQLALDANKQVGEALGQVVPLVR